jgi:hypothetical protein
MRNAYRTAQVKAEVAQIEAEIARKEAVKKFEADRPAREAAAQQKEFERREFKKRLLLDPAESQDFRYTKYDGHLGDATADQVTAAIRSAWAQFLELHDLDKQAQQLVTMFLQLHSPNPDLTKCEVFEEALAYLESRLCPAPETTVAPVTQVEAEVTEVNPFKAGTEAYMKWDREQYRKSVLTETILGDAYRSALATIQNDSGKTLSGVNSTKFLSWLTAAPQRRRFPTMEYFRLAFCEFFNAPETLTSADKELMAYNRQVDSMTSDDLKRAVGSTNTYNPNEGYTARRAQ